MYLFKSVALLLSIFTANVAYAAYGNVPTNTDVDPTVVKIKEDDFLGQKAIDDYRLIDQHGNELSMKEYLGKPTILAMSYYRCDGACSVLNRNLWNTLQDVKQWQIGKDFNVVTISFDPHDTPVTLKKFIRIAGFTDGLPDGWKMTTMKNPDDIFKLTKSMGYKFFWSPRDAIFLHPNVYIMLSPKGRVTRYLYGANITGSDMEISITKAMGEQLSPANVINFIVGSCYSYNYKDGKYTVNYPLFIAAGALVFGLTLLIGSFMHMKRRKRKELAARELLRQKSSADA